MTKSTYSTTEFIFNYFNNMILKPITHHTLRCFFLAMQKKPFTVKRLQITARIVIVLNKLKIMVPLKSSW